MLTKTEKQNYRAYSKYYTSLITAMPKRIAHSVSTSKTHHFSFPVSMQMFKRFLKIRYNPIPLVLQYKILGGPMHLLCLECTMRGFCLCFESATQIFSPVISNLSPL